MLNKKFLGDLKMPASKKKAPPFAKKGEEAADDVEAPADEEADDDIFGDAGAEDDDAAGPLADVSDDDLLAEAKKRGLSLGSPADDEEEESDDEEDY